MFTFRSPYERSVGELFFTLRYDSERSVGELLFTLWSPYERSIGELLFTLQSPYEQSVDGLLFTFWSPSERSVEVFHCFPVLDCSSSGGSSRWFLKRSPQFSGSFFAIPGFVVVKSLSKTMWECGEIYPVLYSEPEQQFLRAALIYQYKLLVLIEVSILEYISFHKVWGRG